VAGPPSPLQERPTARRGELSLRVACCCTGVPLQVVRYMVEGCPARRSLSRCVSPRRRLVRQIPISPPLVKATIRRRAESIRVRTKDRAAALLKTIRRARRRQRLSSGSSLRRFPRRRLNGFDDGRRELHWAVKQACHPSIESAASRALVALRTQLVRRGRLSLPLAACRSGRSAHVPGPCPRMAGRPSRRIATAAGLLPSAKDRTGSTTTLASWSRRDVRRIWSVRKAKQRARGGSPSTVA
jgi:hypothetical protein